MNREHARLVANARRARTIMDREQQKGTTDMSVRQTRRMALSVAASQRALGACRRESIHLFHRAIGVLCINCPVEPWPGYTTKAQAYEEATR